jgi:hypothetical protein
VAGYVKLFGSILDSTVWKLPPAITKVWVTLMAMADRDGVVEASLPGLADRAKVPLRTCEKAVGLFLAPDPHSKSKDQEGRRIETVPRGWRLINFETYRELQSVDDRKQKNAERQRRFRERHGERVTPPVTQSNAPLRSVTVGDASCSDLSGSGSSSPPPLRSDPDPDARSNPSAETPLTGWSLRKIFSEVRANATGGLPWVGPAPSGGRDTTMAELINAEPGARADVAQTIALLIRQAKLGKAGEMSAQILRDPSFGFATWCSRWTALREEIHGMAPSASKPPSLYREL